MPVSFQGRVASNRSLARYLYISACTLLYRYNFMVLGVDLIFATIGFHLVAVVNSSYNPRREKIYM